MDSVWIKPERHAKGLRSGHPLANGLVGFWPMWEGSGDKAMDVLPNRNDLTLTNMAPASDWIATPYGHGLDLDGSDDRLINTSLVGQPVSAITIIAIVALDVSDVGFIAQKIIDDWTDGWALQWSNNKAYWYVNGSGSCSYSQDSLGWSDWEYHQIALSWDNSTPYGRIFADGKETICTHFAPGQTGVTMDSTATFALGAKWAGTYANHLVGRYLQASLHSCALTAGEIEWLYREPWDLITHRTKTYFFLTAAPAGNRRRRVLICGRRVA